MTIERIPVDPRGNPAEWHAHRKPNVTASTAGCLLGVHPYVTAYGLYLLKSGLVEDDPEETPTLRRGRLLEPVAAQVLLEDHPRWEIKYPVGLYVRDTSARLGATPDILATDEHGRRGVIQVKTVEPGIFRRQWRNEDGAIDPPLWIVVQAIIEAHLTGAEWAAVAPMVIGFGVEVHVIPIPIHDGIIDRIKAEVAAFWQCVEARTPPAPDYGRDGALIAKMFPADAGTSIDLSGDNRIMELVDQLAIFKADIKQSETHKTEIENEIKAKLGSHTYGRLGDGRVVSWKTVNRKAYEVAASSYRQLRVLNGRSS